MKNSAEKPRRRLKKGTVSALQDLAIVLLLVLGVALSAAGGLLPADVVAGWLAGKAQSGEEADEGYAPAAAPYCIVLTPEDGAHCAVMYSGEELAETYGRFSAMLGEALGSSFGAEAVTEDDWRAALGGQGVYFDFYNDFLLSTYAIWLGTTMTGDSSGHTARRICLAIEDGAVALYYVRPRANDGRYYFRCETALPADALAGQLSSAVPNGAEFRFERAGYEHIDPYFVMTADTPQVYSATAHSSFADLGEAAAMDAFGMNSYLAQSYPESDGTLVWVDGESTMRVGTDGTVYYASPQPEPGEVERLGPAAAIELGRTLVEATLGRVSGDAQVQLSYIVFDESAEAYELWFSYTLNGLPVELPGGQNAAVIRLVGRTVYDVELRFRAYTLENATENVLPVDMAASIADAAGGGEPRLSYIDGAEGVTVNWPVK